MYSADRFLQVVMSCMVSALLLASQPLRAELIADNLWQIKTGDTLEKILEELFAGKPNLQASMQNIVRSLNPAAFDVKTQRLIAERTLQVPGVKLPVNGSETARLAPKPDGSPPVADVLVAVGDIQAVDTQGNIRVLNRKSKVYAGDSVQTVSGASAQMRFTDGALVSLRENTRFRIDVYHYNGKQDGSEQGVFSLLKGGFRTISGYIGALHKKQYSVKTPVATIGIRGTHYGLRLCDAGECGSGSEVKNGLYGGVIDGGIVVSNKAGERIFNNDQYFHVHTDNVLPKGMILPPNVIFDGAEFKLNARRHRQDSGDMPTPQQVRYQLRQQLEQLHERQQDGHSLRETVAAQLLHNKPGIDQPRFEAGNNFEESSTGGSGLLGLLDNVRPAPSGSGFVMGGLHRDSVQPLLLQGAVAGFEANGTPDQLILLDEVNEVNGIHIPVGARFRRDAFEWRTSIGDAHLLDAGGDSLLGAIWGRWDSGYRLNKNVNGNSELLTNVGSLHFMYSPNVSTRADLLAMKDPLVSRVTFSFAGGGTLPTDQQGELGVVNYASMMVDFNAQQVTDYRLNITHASAITSVTSVYDVALASAGGQVPAPVSFDTLFSRQQIGDGLSLQGSVCSPCTVNGGPSRNVTGRASVVFLNRQTQLAAAAMSSYALRADPGIDGTTGLPLSDMGTSGVVLLKR